jgi:ubiquinone/menaquinone biosynthesis C-methylase UbiE
MMDKPASLQERGEKMENFNNPSAMFRLEDRLKGLIGGPLYYAPYLRGNGGLRGDEDVLDFGCGGGVGTRTIASMLTRGGSVTGVDISSYFSEMARKRTARYPVVRILRGEITGLNLSRQGFDLIVIIHVLHDIPKDKRSATVRELSAVLRPKGRLWIWEPTRMSHGMPTVEIRGLMEEAGLTEVCADTPGQVFKGIFTR